MMVITLAVTGTVPLAVRASMMVITLAVTGTVPLTVDPSAVDVMVTIRLRSNCAWTGCGASKPQPTIADSAIA